MPEIRAGVAAPLLVEVDTAAADDRHRHQELRRLEAGAVDDDVDVVLDAVVGDHARRGDLADGFGDEVDVVALERARPHAVVAQHALRAHGIVGHDLRDEVGAIGELGLEVRGEEARASCR